MGYKSLALLGLLMRSALAVPRVQRYDGKDQPISGAKGAPILGMLNHARWLDQCSPFSQNRRNEQGA